MPFTPCGALSILTDAQFMVLSQIEKKFRQLQRIALLLEKAGDISPYTDIIFNAANEIIPVVDITVSAYDSLRRACPMLGLPPADTSAISDLQYQISKAYADFLRLIDLHGWFRMLDLQAKLDDLIQQGLNAIGRDWWICAEAICNVTKNITIRSLKTNFEKGINTVKNLPVAAENIAKSGYSVLNDTQKKKSDQIVAARDAIIDAGKSDRADIQLLFKRVNTK